MTRLLELYNTFDADKNSSLDLDEFKAFMRAEDEKAKAAGSWVDERPEKAEELHRIANAITPTEDGVSFADFALMMTTYTKKLIARLSEEEAAQ